MVHDCYFLLIAIPLLWTSFQLCDHSLGRSKIMLRVTNPLFDRSLPFPLRHSTFRARHVQHSNCSPSHKHSCLRDEICERPLTEI